eukprot:90558_1
MTTREALETDNNPKDSTPFIGNQNKKHKHTNCNNRKIAKLCLVFTVILITFVILIATNVIPNPFKSDKDNKTIAGIFGKWPSYGGTPKNQQSAPLQSNILFSDTDIIDTNIQCTFTDQTIAYSGYITIDDDNYGYVTDGAGNVFKMDLNNCTKIWNVNIAQLLGYGENSILRMRNTASLFRNSHGKTGILFGTPNNLGGQGVNIPKLDGCWAVALSTNNGSLMFATNLKNTNIDTFGCMLHGFMIDENDHFAYGGMAMSQIRDFSQPSQEMAVINRGKMFKLDIDTGEVMYTFHTIDDERYQYDEDTVNVSYPYIYRGCSVWNMPAIIDKYLIFGTGNLYTYPKYIEQCLLGNYSLPIEDMNPFDPCGNNRSADNKYWRCLEKGIYVSSFIILNKNNFNLLSATPLVGIDAYEWHCIHNNIIDNRGCMKITGPDSDLAAVAAFTNPVNNKLYAAAAQKSGHFFVFAIPSGETIIAKKVGPWSDGGGSQWSIAVAEEHMIAIVTITGGTDSDKYKTVLSDGRIVCEYTGSVHAVDLNNGDTIWQSINPWGTINDCNDPIYDNYTDIAFDIQCETENIKPPSETVINVEIPPINEIERGDIANREPGRFTAPVTIVNNMVFVPSYSGDIFVHNLFDGSYIHTLQCPKNTEGKRDEIKGGVSVVDDKIVFYCGTGMIVSMTVNVSLHQII